MKFYFIKTPSLFISFYKKYIWRFHTNKKEIYLTFDDGPTPIITDFVLETLKKYHAKATFFCIGKNIKKHPELFQKIIDQGHSIGNHTYNHLNGWKTNTDDYIKNVEKCQFKLQHSKLFRPPYGRIKKKQAKLLVKKGYKIIMWSVLSADFDKSIAKETCCDNVIKNTKQGSIVVFHDSKKAFKNLEYTLPKILEHFSLKKYVFKQIAPLN